MDKTTCEGTVKYYINRSQKSQWREGKGADNPGISELWRRKFSIVKFLCESSNQGNDNQEARGVSHAEAGTRFEEIDHEDGAKKELLPTYNKHYIHDTR
ncbi:hypothetical protein GLOIN_2v1473570 [Rhizophagus clarus]|uniref:Uncharacterized protein n=1 Tax=Rhizophagus clarus TaxID=94130 RepID=A0A8H3LP39_9GLOM|nr:hypothetical protein GLOIN_2v1473570 [Rhizophagus clarus]